jgi:hypothetical protein
MGGGRGPQILRLSGGEGSRGGHTEGFRNGRRAGIAQAPRLSGGCVGVRKSERIRRTVGTMQTKLCCLWSVLHDDWHVFIGKFISQLLRGFLTL